MSVSLTLLLTAGVLITCGVYLVLERTLTRIMLGFILAGNGVNLLFIVAAGTPGLPPFEGSAPVEDLTDPLPFAMVLTAVVITLGVTAFGMALAYRAWQLFGHDEVPDDVEDRRVLGRSRRRGGGGPELSRSQGLTEENRRGALLRSQGLADEEDLLGGDLSSAADAPQDPTESDEGDPSPRWRRTSEPSVRGRSASTGRPASGHARIADPAGGHPGDHAKVLTPETHLHAEGENPAPERPGHHGAGASGGEH
ncbi:Na(+)/H(+) antiporter subunit C [Brachybacterium sp. EF45031]|nr:Na(+)/H(+) antiporter subunit C [Brachybacterium sillae]